MSATDILKLDDSNRPALMEALSLYISWVSDKKEGVTVGEEWSNKLYKEYDRKLTAATKLYTSIKL